MQLGFVSSILFDLNLAETLQAARELDYDSVELMCWPVGKASRRYAGVTHIDVTTLNAESIQQIRQQVDESGVQISGLGYYGNPLSNDESEAHAAAAHVKVVIEACSQLGITRMNTFIGRDWKKSVDENFENFETVWKPIVKLAEENGVYIGIENCPMIFTKDEWPGGKNLASSPAIWRRMFSEIPSDHFGLNYDPSHLVWMQMDEVTPLKEFAKKLFHVHAKDMYIDRQALNDVGVMGLPGLWSHGKLPGRGEVNWQGFFQTLTEVGYHGHVCVEVEDRDYENSLDGRRLALKESLQFLRRFIPRKQ
ncbi:sugar phosphate isomerase/epimerase family protein [Planctomicrobium sp. SH668]|uniref:sugar phosphate isomerase/epimerase family protein n=1 Tax=Planctomicrobium sp. SH668 TaxID=3448126 RepID=UPI003F5C82AF